MPRYKTRQCEEHNLILAEELKHRRNECLIKGYTADDLMWIEEDYPNDLAGQLNIMHILSNDD